MIVYTPTIQTVAMIISIITSTIVSDGKYHIKKASQIIYPTK